MNNKRIVNLSHNITNDVAVYPGDPKIRIKVYKDVRSKGTNVMELSFGSHTATHIDAPSHVIEGGDRLNDLEPMGFFGIARCVKVKGNPTSIKPDILLLPDTNPGEAIFIDTGHAAHWNTDRFYNDWPCLSKESLDILLQKKVIAFGIDTPSVDPRGSKDKYNHKTLLKNGILVYENVANLDKMNSNELFIYLAIPLPLKDADGSPVNIIALAGDEELINSVSSYKEGLSLI